MKFVPDYSNIVQEIQPGLYRGALLSAEAYEAKKGTSCVKTTFQIADGAYKGRVLPLFTPINGKGADFFRRLVRCFDPSYVEGGFDFDNYINTVITLEVVDSKGLNGERNYLKVIPVHSIQSHDQTPVSGVALVQ